MTTWMPQFISLAYVLGMIFVLLCKNSFIFVGGGGGGGGLIGTCRELLD